MINQEKTVFWNGYVMFSWRLCLTSLLFLYCMLLSFNINARPADIPHPRLYLENGFLDIKKRSSETDYQVVWKHIMTDAYRFSKNMDNILNHNGKRMKKAKALRRAIDLLPQMVIVYKVTNDKQILNAVFFWMDKLAGQDDWFGNDDMAAAYAIYHFSIAYDWLFTELSANQRNKYRDALASHARHMSDLLVNNKARWSGHMLQNHNYVNAMAIGVAGIVLDGEIVDASDWQAAAKRNFSSVLDYLSSDGASHEGVAYWSTGVGAMLKYYVAVSRWDDLEKFKTSGFFKNTASYRLHMSVPGYVENADYADSPRFDYQGPGYILHGLAFLFNDPQAQWLGDKIDSVRNNPLGDYWLSMIWRDDKIKRAPPNSLETYKLFDGLGLFVHRDKWIDGSFWAMFKAGATQGEQAYKKNYYAHSHIHPDSGHYVIWNQGNWVVLDDGYVLKKRTENHNVFLFNGKGQLGSGARWFRGGEVGWSKGRARIEYADLNSDYQFIVADMTGIYRSEAKLTSWRRSFITFNNGLVVVNDKVSLKNNGLAENFIFVPETARVIDEHTICLDETDGYLLYSTLPDNWQMSITEHLISKNERKKGKGNYKRKKIIQNGLVENEVNITNIYMRLPGGCKSSVNNSVHINANELEIIEQKFTTKINLSKKQVIKTKHACVGC